MIRKTLASLIAFTLFASTALADAGQGSLWAERRHAQASKPGNVQYAALPVGGIPGPASNLLQQMPDLKRTISRPEPISINGEGALVPAGVQSVIERIPAAAAQVRELFVAPGADRIVLLIQDVHLNREAQENIASLLTAFGPEPITIGVEGASGKADLSPMEEIRDSAIRKAVAATYLHSNEISASSYAGIVAPKGSVSLTGIDHPEHYRANVDAYRQSQRLKPETLKKLDLDERSLQTDKGRVLKGELAKFDGLRSEYEKGRMGIGPYIERLLGFKERLANWDWKNDEIDRFVQAYRMETSLDFKKVEIQRSQVLEKLVRSSSDAELKSLLASSLSYRAGNTSYATFYRFFDKALTAKKISLEHAPDFKRYVDYVMLSDRLNADRLLSAMGEMEASLMKSLASTDEEKEILARSHQLYLRRKLVDFALTPNEWQQYRSVRNDASLEEFEKFYSEADVRSDFMVDRVVEILGASAPTVDGVRRSILVAGGFHTPMLTATLRKRNISFAVVQPRITKVNGDGNEYLSIFVREKTPLEKIFEGEKLFLAPAQINAGFPAATAVTNQMSVAGRAIEQPGQVVDSRTPGVVATTSNAAVPGATQVGEKQIEGRERVRFLQRAANLLSRARQMVSGGRSNSAATTSVLGRLQSDPKMRAMFARAIGLPDAALLDRPGQPQAAGLKTDSELLAALRAFRPGYPVGVPLHLDSHEDLITNLLAESESRSSFRRITDRLLGRPVFTREMAIVARLFVESHDLGYSINWPGDNEKEDYPTRLAAFEAEYKDRLVSVWKTVALASGADEATATRQANDTYAVVRAAATEKNMKAYMVPKVLAHGTTSIALTVTRLEAAGFTQKEALGMALLFAAHHPGYPITMVEQFVVSGAIPLELLPVLLINDVQPSGDGGFQRGNPDDLRMRVADYAAGLLGISKAEARQLATLGYSLDRITPARRMQALDLSKVQFNDDGTVKSAAQDFWTGGETSKKYPLIVTNIKKFASLTVQEIYRMTIGNLQQEADAAIKAATEGANGLNPKDAGGLAGLKAVVQAQSTLEIAATREIQDRALAWVTAALPGFSGALGNLDADIRLVRAAYEAMPEAEANREAAGYLLGTLIAIKSNGMALGHFAGLQKEDRFDRELTDGERQISADHLNQRRVTEAGDTTVRAKMAQDVTRVSNPSINSFKALRTTLMGVLNENMRISLDSLEAKNNKFRPMRLTRQRSIEDAMKSLSSDFDSVAWMFPNDLERQRKAAVMMVVAFHMLLLQDEADLELPYVSHSLQHAHDVRNGVFDVLQVWRSMPNGEARLQETYGPASGFLMLMAAWLHDIGYGTLTTGQKAADAKAGELGVANYKSGKGYHTRLGLALANTPLSDNGQTLMDLMDDLFGLSQRPALAAGSKNGREDFEIMILSHGADKAEVKTDGLPGTGKHAFRPASDTVDPMNFAVRLADNLDARIEDRLYSYQKNPIFWGFLMKLAARNTPASEVKEAFIANRAAYIQATILHLETTEGVTNGEALARATADFDITRNNLDSFDYSNYAHFAGMVKNYELKLVDGKLQVLVTLNHEDKTVSAEFRRFQMMRMRESFASLSFLGKPVEVVEAERPDAELGFRGDPQVIQRELMRRNENYRGLLTAYGEQAVSDYPDKNQETLILSLIEYFERHGEMALETEVRPVGDQIIQKGSSDKDVFLVVEGEVTVERDGQPFRVAAGNFVGEMAIASLKGKRNADARVSGTQPAKLLRIRESEIRKFFADPLFLTNYADFIAKRRPVADDQAAAAEARTAIESLLPAVIQAAAEDVDPTAAMSLGEIAAGNAETRGEYRDASDVRGRIIEAIVTRTDQAEAQQELIQAFLAYDREHPSDNIFSTNNVMTLRQGRVLIQKDTLSDDVYVVLSGNLTVTNGITITTDAGSIVGEMAMINGGRRTATVLATTEADVLQIPGSVLRSMVKDERVRTAFQKLVHSRIEQSRAAYVRYGGTLTAQFTLAIGRFLFGWLRALGLSQKAVDTLTRLTVALVIEAPMFALSMVSPRFLAWFVDSHFRDGVGDTAENRRQLRNGIIFVNTISAAALVVGAIAAASFGLSTGNVMLTALAAAVAGNVLSHFGYNLRTVLANRSNDRRQAAAQGVERDVVRALQPFGNDQAVSREVLQSLISILTPRADRPLGLANAANARAISNLISEIRPDDGLTRAQLADIIAPALLLLTTRETVIDQASPEVRDARERLQAPEAVVRVTAAKTLEDIRAQVNAARASKKANDVLVLAVDANVSDEVINRPEFQSNDVRVVRNNPSLQLTEDALRGLTGLGAAMSRASVTVSRQVAMTDDLLQKIQSLKQSMGDRLTLLLLLDEVTRVVPVAVEQLSELVRVQRLIAIQA